MVGSNNQWPAWWVVRWLIEWTHFYMCWWLDGWMAAFIAGRMDDGWKDGWLDIWIARSMELSITFSSGWFDWWVGWIDVSMDRWQDGWIAGLKIRFVPFPRICTVEPFDEIEKDFSDVRYEFVMKKRVGTFWNFQISNLRVSPDCFWDVQERPFWTKTEKKWEKTKTPSKQDAKQVVRK